MIPAFKICTTKNAFLYVEQKDRAYLDKWIPWRIKGAYVEVKDKKLWFSKVAAHGRLGHDRHVGLNSYHVGTLLRTDITDNPPQPSIYCIKLIILREPHNHPLQ